MDGCDLRDERPLKRTRQACDSCRRKKSKCSGERPVCATCERLRRQCSYTMDHPYPVHTEQPQHEPLLHSHSPEERFSQALAESEKRWQNRIESLESTLAELLQGIRNGNPPSISSRAPQQSHEVTAISPALTQSIAAGPTEAPQSPFEKTPAGVTLPSNEVIQALAQTYLTYCDSQPLPLFSPVNFPTSFAEREPEVIYAVLAFACKATRSPQHMEPAYGIDPQAYIRTAHQLTLSRVVSQRVELSTLQTLILLAFHELTNGNIQQCRVHCSMVATMASCAELQRDMLSHRDERMTEERRRCYWSIVLLHRFLGETIPIDNHQAKPVFPNSPGVPPTIALSPHGERLAASLPLNEGEGIISVVLQLTEAWSIAQRYIKSQRYPLPGLAPWSPKSEYSQALATIMDTGQKLPPVHRYRSIRLSHISSNTLEDTREYWGPWFLSRFVYHTSLCLLNHPILIMRQLQGSKDVSEIFLQQSVSSLSHHTKWVIHFVEFLESRHFFVSDPIIAYCAAVAATIELHQSFLDDDLGARKKKRQNYDACIQFVSKMRLQWPCVDQIVKKLQMLAETMSISYENIHSQKTNSISIDISGFFDILDISSVFSISDKATTDKTIFGPTLASEDYLQSPNQTSLIRLPSITAIETRSETSVQNNAPESDEDPAVQAIDAHGTANAHIFSNDMLLPADQLFSHYFHNINTLDAIFGESNSDNPLI